jgi:hypothetical protein
MMSLPTIGALLTLTALILAAGLGIARLRPVASDGEEGGGHD